MQKLDLWSSLVLLFLGVTICYGSLSLGLGTWTVPGPGFLPLGASLALISLSTSIFILAIIKKGRASYLTKKIWPRPDSWKVAFLVLISLIIYNLLWTKLGFSLSTFLFMGFLFRVIGKRSWWVAISGAGLSSFTAYMLFELFLKSQLPTGIVGF